jgi:hypothetical protein
VKALAVIFVLCLAALADIEPGRGEGSATAPIAVTGRAQPADAWAYLNGTVDPGGLETRAWFEWGPTPALGSSTQPVFVGAGSQQVVTERIEGLESFTEYYFRVVATNASGTGVGEIVSFGTLPTETPPPCIVPRVVGKRLTMGRKLIRKAGCRVGQIRRTQSRRRKGIILSQAPRSGTRLWTSVSVRLVVSSGRR